MHMRRCTCGTVAFAMSMLTCVPLLTPTHAIAQSSAPEPAFALHSGDRVLFYGDSITDQRMYTTITELYVVTRYPNLPVTFINSGWGGDRVTGGGGGDISTRLSRDVKPYKPTVVTIMLGMNDGGYKAATAASDETYFRGYEHIVTTVQHDNPGVRITAIEPSPYDNVTRPSAVADGSLYNQVLIGYSQWIANYAAAHNLGLADANTPIVHLLEATQQTNPAVASQILPDHVHPAFGGHMILAESLLKSWQARPTVAAVALDASGGKPQVRAAAHAQVTALSAAPGGGISWTEVDDALPLPFAQWQAMWGGGPTIPAAIQNSDISTALNSEPLTVTGLHSGVYALSIDGTEVATWNTGQLAAGVNLALLKTPMSDQAYSVYQLATEHVDLHWDRWRHVQVELTSDGVPAGDAIGALDRAEAEVVAKERAAARPRQHTFVLKAVQ